MLFQKIIAFFQSIIISVLSFFGMSTGSVEIMPFGEIDNTKWNYNSLADVWWQAGLTYCEKAVDTDYQTLGIYVPGKYMSGEKNDDGYYTCTLTDETVNGYTADTAPIVIPVNTPGYSACKAPTGYESSAESYTDAGFVYVYAGCRGRDSGAPAGVTDLKAAIRYIRWNDEALPGDTGRIFSFGHSGGGAQSSLLGATGDSEMYLPYLEAIGAVISESDAVCGAMCWCPITALDIADAAYEWNMGVTRNGLTEEEKELSDALANAYAQYINAVGLKDVDGNVLSLTESESGIYQSGSYYDYVCGVVAQSIEDYIETKGYNAKAYVRFIDFSESWVKYENGEVIVTSLSGFASKYKDASKDVCAFDALDRSQTENMVFGLGNSTSLHFDSYLYEIVKGTEYESDFAEDLAKTDSLGNSVSYRMNMYNPMYFVSDYYEGYNTATVAEYWRIRSGIKQGDTALTTEINLALALDSLGKEVDFATVWGQGHTEAEVNGSASDNFIAWVNDCCKADS